MQTMAISQSLTSTITLNDGVEMPLFGLGTGTQGVPAATYYENTGNKERGRASMLCALQHGYRMIDSAVSYLNEDDVCQAIKEAGLSRKDVFLVSKMEFCYGREPTVVCVNESLKKFDTSYVDLYLVHNPVGGKILETYDALLDLKQQGLIRSVGVSNFGVHHLEGLINSGRPLPSVNQIELHPFNQSEDLVKFCREKGIALMAFCPLSKGQKLDDPGILELSKKYGKTPAQVMIRWGVQQGYIMIPKSMHSERIIENSQVFGWELSQQDMDLLGAMPNHTAHTYAHVMTSPWTG